jgi:large subunit ribosomal protein L32e
MKKFVRRSTLKFSRMGRGRRKLQRWRRATGRHNKMRKNRFGYAKSPRIGFKSPRKDAGKIEGRTPVLVRNLKDFLNLNEKNILIIARTVGAKKRIDMIKKANEMKFKILNVKIGVENGSK